MQTDIPGLEVDGYGEYDEYGAYDDESADTETDAEPDFWTPLPAA